MTNAERHPSDIAYAALIEAGRPDLAMLIAWFEDDGGYIEVDDLILSEAEWAIIAIGPRQSPERSSACRRWSGHDER